MYIINHIQKFIVLFFVFFLFCASFLYAKPVDKNKASKSTKTFLFLLLSCVILFNPLIVTADSSSPKIGVMLGGAVSHKLFAETAWRDEYGLKVLSPALQRLGEDAPGTYIKFFVPWGNREVLGGSLDNGWAYRNQIYEAVLSEDHSEVIITKTTTSEVLDSSEVNALISSYCYGDGASEPGANWENLYWLMSRIHSNGLKVYPILGDGGFTPKIGSDQWLLPDNPEAYIAHLYIHARAVVRMFVNGEMPGGTEVSLWQIENEINYAGGHANVLLQWREPSVMWSNPQMQEFIIATLRNAIWDEYQFWTEMGRELPTPQVAIDLHVGYEGGEAPAVPVIPFDQAAGYLADYAEFIGLNDYAFAVRPIPPHLSRDAILAASTRLYDLAIKLQNAGVTKPAFVAETTFPSGFSGTYLGDPFFSETKQAQFLTNYFESYESAKAADASFVPVDPIFFWYQIADTAGLENIGLSFDDFWSYWLYPETYITIFGGSPDHYSGLFKIKPGQTPPIEPKEAYWHYLDAVIFGADDPYKPPTASIQSISAVPGPMPAVQGRDTLTFIGSGEDGDDEGELPEIRTYHWTSDLGKTDGNPELYTGTSASFSLPASDLRTGTHTISLTVQDNESDWSEPVTAELTINQSEPAEGYDIAVGLYVPTAGVTHSPGSNVTGEVWAINNGNYNQSGDLVVRLEKELGELLDTETFSFSDLGVGQTTPHHSFSLESNYEGVASVRGKAIVELDEDWSNNEQIVPIYFSSNPNPTDSFDGFQLVEITSGETKIVYDRGGYGHTIEFIGVSGPSGDQISIDIDEESMYPYLGDYILGLPWTVIQIGYRQVGTWTYGFYFWWPDNLYTFSTQYLAIPDGGTATFEVSRTNGSWPTLTQHDIEFISGLQSGGWDHSVSYQDGKMVVQVQAPHGSGATNLNGWAHMYRTIGSPTNYTDAFQWMRFQSIICPPETVINSGPEGTISTHDVTFEWSGFDDTTETSQLQYAYKLEPFDPDFGTFSNDTEKAYSNLDDGSYTFYVKARDLGGTEDPEPASRTFTINTNRIPNMPINQFPLSGQSGLSLTPTLIGSEFSDPDNGDTFAKSRFQIRSNDGTYDNPQWDSGELSPGTTNVQVNSELDYDKIYWWRCRYQDNNGAWSPWSNETSFVTKPDFLTLSDIYIDGKINLLDFSVVSANWLLADCNDLNDWCNGADINHSGSVGLDDLVILSEFWLNNSSISYNYTVTNLTQLTNGTIQESDCVFNTDGTKIAYRNFHDPFAWDNCDIWVMDVDGSNKTQITSDQAGEFAPSFVPDGRITYTRELNSNDYDIWMVEGNGNNPQSFISGSYRQSNPKWNSNGNKIVYTSEYQYQGPVEIWIADNDGTGNTKLTDHTVDGYCQVYPVFSHSGNFIAYANYATSDADLQIWIMNANGSEKTQIISDLGHHYPMFWWPDDSKIGYIQNGKIWLHDISSDSDTILLEVPSGSIGGWCDLSVNGSKLIYEFSDGGNTHIWIGDVVQVVE